MSRDPYRRYQEILASRHIKSNSSLPRINNWSPKDYLTTTLSVLAFIISSLTVYFNVIRTDESLSIITHIPPAAILSKDKLFVPIKTNGHLSLINSGNRSLIISAVSVYYLQPKTGDKLTCDDEAYRGVQFGTDFQPSVLKPGDGIVIKPTVEKLEERSTDSPEVETKEDGFYFPLETHNVGKDDVVIDACWDISVSGPSNSLPETEVDPIRGTTGIGLLVGFSAVPIS